MRNESKTNSIMVAIDGMVEASQRESVCVIGALVVTIPALLENEYFSNRRYNENVLVMRKLRSI
jgi:hypothetical protein